MDFESFHLFQLYFQIIMIQFLSYLYQYNRILVWINVEDINIFLPIKVSTGKGRSIPATFYSQT